MLRWQLEQAPKARKLLPNILKAKLPIPDVFINEPEVNLGLEFYFQAFQDLTTTRDGMGGPIPWDRIMQYADRYGLDETETEDLQFYLTRMDEAWLDHQEKKHGNPQRL